MSECTYDSDGGSCREHGKTVTEHLMESGNEVIEYMKNPYLTVEGCVDRLYKEYKKHPKLIIACDFDDTLFDFHNKGYDYSDTINVIKEAQSLGFYIVLFTGTAKDKWDWQIKFCADLGIKVDSINKNPIDLPFGNDGKIYYNLFLDDRSGLGDSLAILNKLIYKIKMKEFYDKAERGDAGPFYGEGY